MDQVTLVKSEFRLQQWADIIKNCQSSSQTVVSWCKENGINIKTYYYWLRKLRLHMMDERSLSAVGQEESPPCFKKLDVQAPVPCTQAAVIQQQFKLEPFQPALFLFCGKRCDRLKALV